MAIELLGAPPVLFTPDTQIVNETRPIAIDSRSQVSDEEIYVIYEVQRTLDEIKSHSWRRVALQFPDEMLPDSARVFRLLAQGLQGRRKSGPESYDKRDDGTTLSDALSEKASELAINQRERDVKLTILADTSYGSCCVDEIAAEHIEADFVVHYGRACLSPTARLPVIHIFTQQSLDCEKVVFAFRNAFPDKAAKVLLTADVPYAEHVQAVYRALLTEDYHHVFPARIIHDPSSPIPNRTVPEEVGDDAGRLKQWRMFHISEPATSLLLTLSSRLSDIRIYPTDAKAQENSMATTLLADTSLLLRRRYALVTSLATVSIWGILINTLSVKNYLHIVDHVKSEIAAAGKKSYLFVVGKLNAAKVANFSEIGGWVVIGCWESSLVDSKDLYKPVITPFELELALRRDEERVWTGDWSANFQRVLDDAKANELRRASTNFPEEKDAVVGDDDSEEESAPPDFDLRTGRYISHTRPMQASSTRTVESSNHSGRLPSSALTRRTNHDIVAVNGVASPAAQFLNSRRTWKGLGSDIEVSYEEEAEGGTIQEGRTGIARGYVVGIQGSTV